MKKIKIIKIQNWSEITLIPYETKSYFYKYNKNILYSSNTYT